MTYSPDQIAAYKADICEGIASGLSLSKVLAVEAMPSRQTVYCWLREDKTFSDNYVRAREDQADVLADDIIDIADTETDAAKARNRIEARKWKASRLNAKRYGDKLGLEHSGSIDSMSKEQVHARIAELLGRAGISVPPGALGVAGQDKPAGDL